MQPDVRPSGNGVPRASAGNILKPPKADEAIPATATGLEITTGVTDWSTLYRIGGIAGILMLATIPLAVAAYIVWPPPYDGSGADWITLYQENWFKGLLGLDLLFLLSNVLIIPIYLALFAALKRASMQLMTLALTVGLVGVASYFSSNPAFQMLILSNRYDDAGTDAERAAIVAAAESMLATFEGTAFNVYYVLSAIALLVIAYVMLRSDIFGRATAWTGLIAGAFMIVPATAGTIGVVFSLVSLIPWIVFLGLITRRFLQLGREAQPVT